MRKGIMKIIITSIYIIICFNLYCNETPLSIRLGSNYSYYNLNDLTNLQKQISSDINTELNISLKDLESFPSYFSYEFQVIYNIEPNQNVGLTYEYSTTGARSHYEDYSGEYKIDYSVESYSIGALFERIIRCKISNIPIGVKALLIKSNFEIDSTISIFGINENNSVSLEAAATSFGLEPYTGLQFSIVDFKLQILVAYLLSIESDLHDPSNPEAYLLNPEGKRIGLNWNGFKCGLSIGYNF